jgi:hypothetical protein
LAVTNHGSQTKMPKNSWLVLNVKCINVSSEFEYWVINSNAKLLLHIISFGGMVQAPKDMNSLEGMA